MPEDWADVGFELPDGRVVDAQEISRPSAELASERVRSGDLPRLMHRVHDRELFGLQMRSIEIDEVALRLTFHLSDQGDPDFDAIAAEARLRAAADGAGPDAVWDVLTEDEPRRRLAAVVPAPPLGWTALRVVDAGSVSAAAASSAPTSQAQSSRELSDSPVRQGIRRDDRGARQRSRAGPCR